MEVGTLPDFYHIRFARGNEKSANLDYERMGFFFGRSDRNQKTAVKQLYSVYNQVSLL